jgi:hypothetical protein
MTVKPKLLGPHPRYVYAANLCVVETYNVSKQIAKHETENRRLHAAMQAAALDASRDAQSKAKRIQHLERKVVNTTHICKTWTL